MNVRLLAAVTVVICGAFELGWAKVRREQRKAAVADSLHRFRNRPKTVWDLQAAGAGQDELIEAEIRQLVGELASETPGDKCFETGCHLLESLARQLRELRHPHDVIAVA